MVITRIDWLRLMSLSILVRSANIEFKIQLWEMRGFLKMRNGLLSSSNNVGQLASVGALLIPACKCRAELLPRRGARI